MALFIKLSVINQTGETITVAAKNTETFAEFQSRVFAENSLLVSVDDFKGLDQNLGLGDNFYDCLRKNITHLNDSELLNCDSPLFEINLFKEDEEMTFDRLIDDTGPNYMDIVSQLKEIHNYSEESVQDYCRLCAVSLLDNKQVIFGCFDEQIRCLPIKVRQNDGLPQNVCEKCAINLGQFHEFVQKVLEAEKILKLKFSETDTEYLVEEIEEITNTQNHKCRICDLIIDNLKDALSHSSQDHKINNLYACVFCEYGFDTTISLSRHIQTEHKNFNKHICKICGTHFPYQTLLEKHVCTSKKFQNVKIEYPCDMCSKLFTTKPSLEFHKKMHQLKCETCGKIFADKQILKEHLLIHTKPFQCHVCGKSLNRLSRLKSHLLTHDSTGIREVNCCIDCKEGFENFGKAVLHQNSEHTIAVAKMDKVYRCEFCEKCFINRDGLKIHRKVHNDVNPFVCHVCSARFPSYSRCTSHKTSHGLYKEGGDKQIFPVIKYFLCNSCDNSYLNWTHLASHKKIKHSLHMKTYKCHDCNLEFPNNYGITYHRKTKHQDDPLKCSECGEKLRNYEAWKQHRLLLHANKKYNYQCVKCEKIFQTQDTLEDHLKSHSELNNKCPYCPLSFSDLKDLAVHLKKHRIKKPQIQTPKTNDLRPYCCNGCGLTFRKQFSLKNHQLKHCTKLDKSKFVLMVDDSNETKTVPEIQDDVNEQYFDLGDGNYVRVEPGNTVNIEGEDYVLQLDDNVMYVDQDTNTFNQNGVTYLLDNNQTC